MECENSQLRRSVRTLGKTIDYSVLAHYGRVQNSEQLTDKQYIVSMAQEERINGIEGDMNNLKTQVGDIGSKLDRLIESLSLRDDASTESTGTVPVPPAAPGKHTSAASDPPRHAARSTAPAKASSSDDISYEEYMHREMDRDKFEYSHIGTTSSILEPPVSKLMFKPYMYVSREGAYSHKQKLDIRPTLSAIEYIDAILSLLNDKRAYNPSDYNNIMYHLRKVTRDATERPWPAVRRWSQYVWDMIEAGQITWADKEIIQEERVRISLTAPMLSGGGHLSQYGQTGNNRRPPGSQEVVCRQFNTRLGCQHKESHYDGNVYALHVCTYCDSIGRICQHSVRECERRVIHSRQPNDNAHQHRGRAQYQYNQHNGNQFNAYQSKNGYQAPV